MNTKQSCIVAVIWTFNPDINRFVKVLESIVHQVDQVIVVDNGSGNIDKVRSICNKFNNVTLIELGVNLGVHALNIGINYAIKKFDPEFILLLDDDTVVYPDAISKVLSKLENTNLHKIIGVLCMSPGDVAPEQKGKLIVFYKGGQFSGCIVRTQLIKRGVRIRKEFFLDQADFDFYDKIRKLGFITVLYGEKLIDHRLGIPMRIRLPLIGILHTTYEPPWRYYYIVRNSTVLLMERKINIKRYIGQLIGFIIPLLLVDGITKALRALILGMAHGLFKKLGYLDPRNTELLSSVHYDRLSHGRQ